MPKRPTRGAFAAFVKKELSEFLRSWRLWVLGGFLLFFALASPVLAWFMPRIVASLGGMMPGVQIIIPPSTWADSYAQWIKNLTQMGSFIVVIMGAGAVAGEISSGTAILALTKPLGRGAFVVTKALVLSLCVTALAAVSTAIVQALTLAVFGTAPAWPLWSALMAWVASAVWIISLTILLSCLLPTLASAGLGLLGLALASAANLWKPVERNAFTAFFSAPPKLCMGEWVDLRIPALSLAATAILLLAIAVLVFRRREI